MAARFRGRRVRDAGVAALWELLFIIHLPLRLVLPSEYSLPDIIG